MTENYIWKIKPERQRYEGTLDFERRRATWERKLKIEYDDMRQTLLSIDTVKIKIKDEIREKAEKLEATKKYLDTIVIPSCSDIANLKEILA